MGIRNGGRRQGGWHGRRAPAAAGMGGDVNDVTVADVLEWAGAAPEGLEPGDWRLKLRYRRRRLPALQRHLGHLKVGQIASAKGKGGTVEQFQAKRVLEDRGRPGVARRDGGPRRDSGTAPKKITLGGALQDINLLRMAANAYRKAHGLHGQVKFGSTAKHKPSRFYPLLRDEAAALLFHAAGFSRCREVEFTREPNPRRIKWRRYRKERALSKRTRRENLRRFILLSLYTGSTAGCVMRLRWGGDPHGEASYVDVEEGLLYRLGPDAAAAAMANVPVRLPRRILAHLRRWKRLDQDEAAREGQPAPETVVRTRNKTPAAPWASFTLARDEAGLPPDLLPRHLSEATGLWIMRAGTREMHEVRRPTSVPRPTLRSAAFFCGMTLKAFAKRYERSSKEYHDRMTSKLRKPARSVE